MTLVETLIDHNDRQNVQFSNKKLRQEFSKFMAETEDSKCDAKCNAKNETMDTFCHHYAVTTNTQGEIANMTNERRILSEILAKWIKVFN